MKYKLDVYQSNVKIGELSGIDYLPDSYPITGKLIFKTLDYKLITSFKFYIIINTKSHRKILLLDVEMTDTHLADIELEKQYSFTADQFIIIKK
jgi:hypothetical protein